MSRPVARPTAQIAPAAKSSVAAKTRMLAGTGPQGARRIALRARLRQPMDDSTRRLIAAVASEGLDEIVQTHLLALGPPREAAPATHRRKRQP